MFGSQLPGEKNRPHYRLTAAENILNIHTVLPSYVDVRVLIDWKTLGVGGWGGETRAYRDCKPGRRNECLATMLVCVWLTGSLRPTFHPSIESTPLCFDLGVGLLGEGAEGQPSSLHSAWVVWVCVLLSSDPDSLHKKVEKKMTDRRRRTFCQKRPYLL